MYPIINVNIKVHCRCIQPHILRSSGFFATCTFFKNTIGHDGGKCIAALLLNLKIGFFFATVIHQMLVGDKCVSTNTIVDSTNVEVKVLAINKNI